MNMRRPLGAAQSLNAAADLPPSETTQTTFEQRQATRDKVREIREALIEARLFGPIIPHFAHTYSKLVCPQKNDASTPRTLVVVEADGILKVRHPYDCASDTIRPMLSFQPKDYEGKNLGEFVISAIDELHGSKPSVEPERVVTRKLAL